MNLKVLRAEELDDRICVVVGTRPGIIKFSPIIRELEARAIDFFIIHTGQHYSYEMDKVFFEELSLPEPKYKLPNLGDNALHGEQTARMLEGVEKALVEEKPKIVLVGGDANTNLAGALAARKLQINVGHIEAGLRSSDWRMPEEHNRVMIDHISDFLFAPTEKARNNLKVENVRGKVYVTGNTIVDAVRQNGKVAEEKSRILEMLHLESSNYFLLTLHREENVDFKQNFSKIFRGVQMVSRAFDYDIVFPIHPRTRKRMEYFNQNLVVKKLRSIEPIGYLDFLALLAKARLVLTDSGGIQEESCILRLPCVTLRESTERPETVEVGANYVAGVEPESILKGVSTMLNVEKKWENPFGNDVSRKIVDIVARELQL